MKSKLGKNIQTGKKTSPTRAAEKDRKHLACQKKVANLNSSKHSRAQELTSSYFITFDDEVGKQQSQNTESTDAKWFFAISNEQFRGRRSRGTKT